MTDLEKQIELKRERADAFSRVRTAPPKEKETTQEQNFFAASETAKSTISAELKQFNTYNPVDLSELFNKIEKQKSAPQIEESKPQPTAKPQIKEDYNKDFVNVTKLNSQSPAVFEIPVPKQYEEEKFGIKFNLRGKLTLFVASITMICLLFLAIFNAVAIGNLKAGINSVNREIFYEEQILNGLLYQYNELSDEERLEEEANKQGYQEIPPENIIEFSLLEKAAEEANNNNTNWFDAFCNFVYRLFGGK